jgi:NADPH-dependent curcumin reductase
VAVNRRWLLAARPSDPLAESNFRLVEEPLPEPAPGEALVRNLCLSYDPTQVFAYMADGETAAIPVGKVIACLGAARVVRSRTPEYGPGDLVYGHFGWEDYSITDAKGELPAYLPPARMAPGTSPEVAVAALGISGMAAYFGMLEIGAPKAGETVVVSGAAGGVGCLAGQIARIRGARVVGIAGGPEKCRRLVDELRFDAAIDRRGGALTEPLTTHCPEGIDVLFDNSGGAILQETLDRLRPRGRIVLCGLTSQYLADEAAPAISRYVNLILQNGRMEGFMARDFADRYPAARQQMAQWIRDRKLLPAFDAVDGLENAPKALRRIFDGDNFGKQVLTIAEG